MRVNIRREQISNSITLDKWRAAPSRLHFVNVFDAIFSTRILESRIAELMAAKFRACGTEDRFGIGLDFDVAERLQMVGHNCSAGDQRRQGLDHPDPHGPGDPLVSLRQAATTSGCGAGSSTGG